jgi:hypothetical protein
MMSILLRDTWEPEESGKQKAKGKGQKAIHYSPFTVIPAKAGTRLTSRSFGRLFTIHV